MIYLASMTFPTKRAKGLEDGPTGNKNFSFAIAITLCIIACASLLKLCNKNDENEYLLS